MIFKYKSLNSSGHTITGTIEAPSRSAAEEIIELRNEMLLSIKPKARNFKEAWTDFVAAHTKVRVEDLVIFTRQLATMFRTGIPLMRSLDILREQTEHPALHKAVTEIYVDIENGSSMCNAFRKHPNVFPRLYCSMLAAGEMSGNISEILDRLGDMLSHEAKVKKSVRSALHYPITVLTALTVAFIILLRFVIPRFVPIYNDFGVKLPLPTRVCIKISDLMVNYGSHLLVGLIIATVSVIFFYKRERGRLLLDHCLLRMPLIGNLLIQSNMARFANLFSMMQYSGVLVLDIVRILQQCIGNMALRKELAGLEAKLREGAGISGPLREAKYFTKMIVNMVAVGEESGNLDEMLAEVSKHYDEEIEYAIKKIIDAMNSFLIIFLAIVVGFFAMAVYLPIWNMTEIQMNQ